MPLSRALAPALLVCASSIVGCGGSGPENPVTPTPPVVTPGPPPTSAPTPTAAFAVAGRVVASGTRAPVGGATLRFGGGPPTQSAADGTFRYTSDTNPASTPYRVEIAAPGHVERSLWLHYGRDRVDIQIDLLPLSAPFAFDFYRQLVRNGAEQPTALQPLRRLTRPPSVYVRTVDNAGRDVERRPSRQ